MRIGILAVQGAFAEHEQMLESLGAEHFQIRQKKDLNVPFDGLILPGGESTVMGKLLRELDLFEPLNLLIKKGFPVFGTCAGLLLLAQKISNDDRTYFGSMALTAKRNAYGRQLGSFEANAEFKDVGNVPMIFIRAPYIEEVLDNTQILSKVDRNIVAAKQGNQLVTAFHPELTNNTSVHEHFLKIVMEHKS
ncbi:MAG: glutamine amidotransferase subunit PdxT [Clostridiales bacterium GWF2_38_85]|nr:MAG: glutamine amidotransferase subunit PdxT [Clostridiales bacterium GWF2_38_85]HBL84991.1 pyridoxal 5'-phosphate synthase glutaminase subunit PdxT [Clostridiales bacterium]